MKHIVFAALIAFACPAWAQADKPAAKETASPAAPQEPMKDAAKPAPAKQAGGGPKIPNPRRWNEDARHCLERGTNTDIIKCAEEFL